MFRRYENDRDEYVSSGGEIDSKIKAANEEKLYRQRVTQMEEQLPTLSVWKGHRGFGEDGEIMTQKVLISIIDEVLSQIEVERGDSLDILFDIAKAQFSGYMSGKYYILEENWPNGMGSLIDQVLPRPLLRKREWIKNYINNVLAGLRNLD